MFIQISHIQICEYVDMWICGYLDMWIRGYVDMWLRDMLIYGYTNMSTVCIHRIIFKDAL